jgi:DNA-binding MarR family transcriptional regulator
MVYQSGKLRIGGFQVGEQPMDPEQIRVIENLVHTILLRLGFTRLDLWSDKLEGLSFIDLHLMKIVEREPTLVLGEIRDILNLPNSTMTSTVNRLEEKGLLRRVISQRDRRSYQLELTEEGWKIQREHDRIDSAIATLILQTMDTDEERALLIQLLSKAAEKLGS